MAGQIIQSDRELIFYSNEVFCQRLIYLNDQRRLVLRFKHLGAVRYFCSGPDFFIATLHAILIIQI
jgi:hypothetical protein